MSWGHRRPLIWRIGDAVDEWAHRRGFGKVSSVNGRLIGPWYWRLTPFPWLCDRRDISYGVPKEEIKGAK